MTAVEQAHCIKGGTHEWGEPNVDDSKFCNKCGIECSGQLHVFNCGTCGEVPLRADTDEGRVEEARAHLIGHAVSRRTTVDVSVTQQDAADALANN
jgi:hypothetical protein